MKLDKVDPQLVPALELMQQAIGSSALDLSDIPTARQIAEAITQNLNNGVSVSDTVKVERKTIHDESLSIDVELETYSVAGTADNRPAILYIHGGGYVMGSASAAQPKLAKWAEMYGALVVSVEYRLAPEHPFPAALQDCFAALRWISEFAENLQIDQQRIIVLGESAGGGLAAGLSLYTRDQSDIKIAYQVLVYPMLDHTNIAPADRRHEDTFVWSRENNRVGWAAYFGDGVEEDMLQYAAPATAEDLSGLPPTFIPVGELDLFYQENEDYAERLKSTPVEAEFKSYPGAFHAFSGLMPSAQISQQFDQDIEDVLRRACQA